MKVKEEANTIETHGPSEQPVVVNLEGIKVAGVDQTQARQIAEEAAKRASEALETAYKERVTALEARTTKLQEELDAATQERDALAAEKAEGQRRAAFTSLFDEYAVAKEAREELYEAFAGLDVDAARKLVKNMNRFSTKAASEGDVVEEEDVSSITQQYERGEDDPQKYAESLVAQFQPYKRAGQDN